MIAALFVEKDGPYAGIEGVDVWDAERDARNYAGPHPVVAHPPCQRWGNYWMGGTRPKVRQIFGSDHGCFGAALRAVTLYGGVIEHPAESRAWKVFGIARPEPGMGWVHAGLPRGGWTCYVEQGRFGHDLIKPTWLYLRTLGENDFPIIDTRQTRKPFPKTRTLAWGHNIRKVRIHTPPEFRDLLLDLAGRCRP